MEDNFLEEGEHCPPPCLVQILFLSWTVFTLEVVVAASLFMDSFIPVADLFPCHFAQDSLSGAFSSLGVDG